MKLTEVDLSGLKKTKKPKTTLNTPLISISALPVPLLLIPIQIIANPMNRAHTAIKAKNT